MIKGLKVNYAFLEDLTEDEAEIAKVRQKDRGLVIKELMSLPGGRLQKGLY